jgi:hypothetical protein
LEYIKDEFDFLNIKIDNNFIKFISKNWLVIWLISSYL